MKRFRSVDLVLGRGLTGVLNVSSIHSPKIKAALSQTLKHMATNLGYAEDEDEALASFHSILFVNLL